MKQLPPQTLPFQYSSLEGVVLLMLDNVSMDFETIHLDDDVRKEAHYRLLWHNRVREFTEADESYDAEIYATYPDWTRTESSRFDYAVEKHLDNVNGKTMFGIGLELGMRLAARAIVEPFGDHNPKPDFDAVVDDYVCALKALRESLKSEKRAASLAEVNS